MMPVQRVVRSLRLAREQRLPAETRRRQSTEAGGAWRRL
jgi:hypothetical protein